MTDRGSDSGSQFGACDLSQQGLLSWARGRGAHFHLRASQPKDASGFYRSSEGPGNSSFRDFFSRQESRYRDVGRKESASGFARRWPSVPAAIVLGIARTVSFPQDWQHVKSVFVPIASDRVARWRRAWQGMLSNPYFRSFSLSLKLAVLCLLSLAAVLATATVLESEFGTRAAHVMVYGTLWFYALLLLLGTNVLCAALSRLPWKKRHIGFVTTHVGILTILLGAYLTMRFGVDGSLPVFEGSEDSEVILNNLKLSVMDEEERLAQHFPVPEVCLASQKAQSDGQWLCRITISWLSTSSFPVRSQKDRSLRAPFPVSVNPLSK